MLAMLLCFSAYVLNSQFSPNKPKIIPIQITFCYYITANPLFLTAVDLFNVAVVGQIFLNSYSSLVFSLDGWLLVTKLPEGVEELL